MWSARFQPRRWAAWRISRTWVLAILGGLVLGGGVAAQEPATDGPLDGRWLAWQGCWKVPDVTPGMEEEDEDAEGEVVCIRPDPLEGPAAARITTFLGDEILAEEIVRADGDRHPVSHQGCEGWERARWSHDDRRLFIRSELDCGTRATRTSTRIFAISPSEEWVDIQTVQVGDREDPRTGTRTLRPLTPEEAQDREPPAHVEDRELAVRTARIHAAAPLTLGDLTHALGEADPAALKALILETEGRFSPSARELLALEEAGAPAGLIDLVVAVSFPDRFQIDGHQRVAEREAAEHRARAAPRSRRSYAPNPFRPFGTRFGIHYYSGLRYDPFYFGSFYGPGFHPGGYRGLGPIVVVPVKERDRGGQVLQGRGYTRGGGAASGQGGSPDRRSPARTSPSSGDRPSSGDSRVSPDGHRSSGGEDTGRRARPRDGGDDDDDL